MGRKVVEGFNFGKDDSNFITIPLKQFYQQVVKLMGQKTAQASPFFLNLGGSPLHFRCSWLD